jgi:hypothetical protein
VRAGEAGFGFVVFYSVGGFAIFLIVPAAIGTEYLPSWAGVFILCFGLVKMLYIVDYIGGM